MAHHGINSLLQVPSYLLFFLVSGVHIGHLGTKLTGSKKALKLNQTAFKAILDSLLE